MQKKLYFLNEEEKDRILNLHENRTKNQYLNSQLLTEETKLEKRKKLEEFVQGKCTNIGNSDLSSDDVTLLKNATTGAIGMGYNTFNKVLALLSIIAQDSNGKERFCSLYKKVKYEGKYVATLNIINQMENYTSETQFDEIIKTIHAIFNPNENIEQLKSNFEDTLYANRFERQKQLQEKCNTTNLKFFKYTDTYKRLQKWMTGQGAGGKGKWEDIPNILSQIQNVQEFCELNASLNNGNNEYKAVEGIYRNGIAKWLYKEIYSKSSWIKYFEKPLENVLASAGMETLNSVNQKKSTRPDNPNEENKELNPNPKPNTTNTTNTSNTIDWYSLGKQYDNDILTALGKQPTRRLSNNDIDDIYNKLKNMGKL